jgi:D-sedoheptulose 7-phosphate isomerase
MPLAAAIEATVERSLRATETDGRVLFVGNGGSAAIASHMAIDFSKNGAMRALAFNDGAALTCLANDLGYERIFAAQIEMHGRSGDLLMAISSSGQSASILNAAASARRLGIEVITFSGFKPSNPLRRLGDVNYFVDSDRYGYVEICHLTLVHAVLDQVYEMRQRPAC